MQALERKEPGGRKNEQGKNVSKVINPTGGDGTL